LSVIWRHFAGTTESLVWRKSLLWPALSELPNFALFEDTLDENPRLTLLHGLEVDLQVYSAEALPGAWKQIEAAQREGCWVALAANYELGLQLEPTLRGLARPGCLLQAQVFRTRLQLNGAAVADFWLQQLAHLPARQREAGLLHLTPQWSQAEHARACQQVLDWIAAGDCYQVNLTMPFHGQAYGHPLALYARLRERQRVRYATLLHSSDNWVLSLSPELFVQREGQTLTCKPMKGTAARLDNPQADAEQAAALVASEKNRAENLMIVDLIRNDLGRLAPAGGVRTTRLFELETYATVHQLTSTVQAAPVTANLRETFDAIFPCGSITGAPKIRAMQIIAELEPTPRGIYCGALGWLAPDGDFRFSVPIRTLLLDASGECKMNTGGGIVADSDPAEEYRECLVKARFAQQLTEEVQLIETLRWQHDTGFLRLERHLQRLAHSAQALGFALDPAAIHAALQAEVAGRQDAALRLRLLLARDGRFDIQSFALEDIAGPQTAILASERLDPADQRLRHKTTARRFYDDALRQAMADGHFDVIYCNTRGELCEGARSNLFIERGGQLLTPPLASGVLPGILREELLAEGKAYEAILTEADLPTASRIWLGNSLRGLVEVQLA
jgi:para-aminobenzoate synthetase/4-amino-4-deoxychorismate lyase